MSFIVKISKHMFRLSFHGRDTCLHMRGTSYNNMGHMSGLRQGVGGVVGNARVLQGTIPAPLSPDVILCSRLSTAFPPFLFASLPSSSHLIFSALLRSSEKQGVILLYQSRLNPHHLVRWRMVLFTMVAFFCSYWQEPSQWLKIFLKK